MPEGMGNIGMEFHKGSSQLIKSHSEKKEIKIFHGFSNATEIFVLSIKITAGDL